MNKKEAILIGILYGVMTFLAGFIFIFSAFVITGKFTTLSIGSTIFCALMGLIGGSVIYLSYR